jgi:AraC family transcriptional activator of pobA
MRKKNTILNFEGLYGDDFGRYSSEYIFLEMIATRSQIFDWIIKPHIHSQLFQVFIVINGSVVFEDIAQKHQINSPCIFFIPPTHLHGLAYTPNVEGYILTTSAKIMEDIFKNSSMMTLALDKVHIFNLSEEKDKFEEIKNALLQLEKELFNGQLERQLMLKAHLTQFFILIYRLVRYEKQYSNEERSMIYFRKFMKSIKSSDYNKTIPQYASELNITVVHLNRICQAIAEKSAIDLIQQNIIDDAKKYLLHTSYSVSEIAYQLKFEYPNYFARLFKKHTGLTPQQYRKADRM